MDTDLQIIGITWKLCKLDKSHYQGKAIKNQSNGDKMINCYTNWTETCEYNACIYVFYVLLPKN